MNVFDEAKARVPIRSAVARYGYEPNRAGYICCPFHEEKTPSLKIYEDGFHCFGCQAHGSVIDFVGRLFDLDPLGAVRRLNEDFGLGLPLDRPPSAGELEAVRHRQRVTDARRMFGTWREEMMGTLTDVLKIAHFADLEHMTDVEATAVRWEAQFDYYYDLLSCGSLDDQMTVFRSRREIAQRCATILNGMPTRSQRA